MALKQSKISLLLLLLLTAWATGAGKDNIPSDADQAGARKMLKEIFAEQYADSGMQGKQTLARALLGSAKDLKDDSSGRYVMLSDARDLAVDAGDCATAMEAGTLLGQSYAMDEEAIKITTLVALAPRVKPQDTQLLINVSLPFARQLIEAEEFEKAGQVVTAIVQIMAKSTDRIFLAEIKEPVRELQAIMQSREQIVGMIAKLHVNPLDPAANLEVGKFYCFSRGNWEKGLPLLAKGSDMTLALLAKQDIASKDAKEIPISLPEGWWQLGQQATQPTRRFVLERAAYWYRKGLPAMTGLSKTLVEKRLAEMAIPEAGTRPKGAPADATEFRKHWYKFFEAKVSWSDAVARCRAVGGHLVTIADQEENDFVASLLQNRTAWIGGTRDNASQRWQWLDGSPMKFTPWGGDGPALESLFINQVGNWESAKRNEKNRTDGYICEWEY
jgi:hypothetical protein